jgi:SAM-dependent methyltransferase
METISEIISDPVIICPACGSSTWKVTGQAKDYSVSGEWFELNECTTCHLKATHPQPAALQLGRYYASEEYISHSDTRTGLTNKLFHKARSFMLKKKYEWVVRASGKKSGKLLDVGAGTGYFAKYMQDHGWEVIALEPDETARKVASEKLGLPLQPIESLSVQKPGSFDVITLWHVLEHVHDIKGYMNHFHSLLKTGGILLIAVPNYTSRDARQYGSQWAAYDVPRHLWHFSPESMQKLLTKHGFTLFQKIKMPLDAFYVSMLSEKYRGNYFFGPLSAFISGMKTLLAGNKNVNQASSVIYLSRKEN